SLLAAGKRVGITGLSHKVIGNLLAKVIEASEIEGFDVRATQKATSEQGLDDPLVAVIDDNKKVAERIRDGRANLVAGTPWLWATPGMVDAVDVLFVDEAGQMSLAHVIAIARATKSLVLLGDPQHLD